MRTWIGGGILATTTAIVIALFVLDRPDAPVGAPLVAADSGENPEPSAPAIVAENASERAPLAAETAPVAETTVEPAAIAVEKSPSDPSWPVRVVDAESGQPVPGMRLGVTEGIAAVLLLADGMEDPETPARETVTGADGIARVAGLSGDHATLLSADRFRWLTGDSTVQRPDTIESAPPEVRSYEGGALAGTVIDPNTDDPTSRLAVIRIRDLTRAFEEQDVDPRLPGPFSAESVRVARLGHDGTFELTGIPVGHEMTLEVRGEGRPVLHAQRVRLDQPRAVTRLAPIHVAKYGKVRLIATRPEGGEPDLGATISLVESRSPRGKRFNEALQAGDLANGIVIDEVREGDRLLVEPKAYRPHLVESVALAGGETPIVVPLVPAPVLEGTVTFADAKPPQNVQVWVKQSDDPIGACVIVDESGRFRATGLTEGACRIEVLAQGHQCLWRGEREIRNVRETIAIEIGALGGLRARVFLDGAPYRGVIEAQLALTAEPSRRIDAKSFVSEGGRLELTSLPCGAARLYLWDDTLLGFAVVDVVIGPSAVTDLGDVALAPARRAKGGVIDARSGAPIANAQVAASRDHHPRLAAFVPSDSLALNPCGWTLTGYEGRFELEGLVQEDDALRVTCDGYLTANVALAAGAAIVELPPIRLEPKEKER